jgi:glutamyl aminopeptidase
MLEHFMGPDKFQNGISKFLNQFRFQNADTNDLWVELQSEMTSDTNISLLMATWTRQMGYPVLITKFEPGLITVKQERFLENREAPYNKSDSPFRYRWEIPIRIVAGGGNQTHELQTVLMRYTQETSKYLMFLE